METAAAAAAPAGGARETRSCSRERISAREHAASLPDHGRRNRVRERET